MPGRSTSDMDQLTSRFRPIQHKGMCFEVFSFRDVLPLLLGLGRAIL